jgi:DNA mismatch repair ATPase MutL
MPFGVMISVGVHVMVSSISVLLFRSIKKHFQKMVRVVQSYALISIGVKIVVTNTNELGAKQVVFTTQSGGKLSDNVSILFGAKFAASLLPLDVAVELPSRDRSSKHPSVMDTDTVGNKDDMVETDESPSSPAVATSSASPADDLQRHAVPTEENIESVQSSEEANPPTVSVRITGLASKAGVGVGRSDNDRQFTFVNGRPVDLPRFAKVMNEVWRRYEMKQKPAFVLDIAVPPGYFDVNLTPDKREVLIVHEAVILERLREYVDALYLPARSTMLLNQGMGDSKLPALWSTLPTAATVTPGEVESAADEENGEEVAVSGRSTQGPAGAHTAAESATKTSVSQSVRSPVLSPPPLVWASQHDRERILYSPQRTQFTADGSNPASGSKRRRIDEGNSAVGASIVSQVSDGSAESQRELTQPPERNIAAPQTVQFVRKSKPLTMNFASAINPRDIAPAAPQHVEEGDPTTTGEASTTAPDADLSDAFDVGANAPVSDSTVDRSSARVLSKKVRCCAPIKFL